MADEPIKFEYRVPRVMVWLYGLGSLLCVGSAIWTALPEPWYVSEWERFARIGWVLLHAAAALLLAKWSAKTSRLLPRGPFFLELTDDCIKIPFHFAVGPIAETIVRFEQVTRIRHVQFSSRQRLVIWYEKQHVEIPAGLLADSEDFDTLRATLTSRLEAHGVTTEEWAFRFSRPQFSLRLLFLLTTVLAVILGIAALAGIQFHWTMLVPLAFFFAAQAGALGLLFGPPWLRALVLGAALGCLAEVLALVASAIWDLAPIAGGRRLYPFTFLFWPDSTTTLSNTRIGLAVAGGVVVSAMLFGAVAVGLWAWAKKRSANRAA